MSEDPAEKKPEQRPEIVVWKVDMAVAIAIADDIQKQLEEAQRKRLTVSPKTIFTSAVLAGLKYERDRATKILGELCDRAEAAANNADALSGAARIAGDHATAEQLEGQKMIHVAAARAMAASVKEIVRDPEACKSCSGVQFVPSKLAPGQMVPCEACKPEEPTATATAAGSSGS